MVGLKPLETVSDQAADDLEQFIDKLKKTDVGSVLRFPSFVFPDLERAKKQSPEVSGVMDALRSLSGSYVRVLKSHRNIEMALHIRDALPIDISPMLVLDASGSVRQTYCAWSEYRGGLIHLPSVRKNYSPLTVHFMKRGGGKDSWRQSSHELAQEVADAINSRPDEKFLVVHHKSETSFDPQREILRLVEGNKKRVQFIHWGQHQATNAYREIPNVILAGVMHLPDSQHSGLAYASTGYQLTEDLPDGLTDKIRLGELGHAILQAAGRGVMRGFEDGSCPPCNLYIIAAAQSGIEGELPKLFPGCSTRSWKRRHKDPKGKVKAALEYIQQQRQQHPSAPVMFADVMTHLGISDRPNFNRTIRKHPDFKKGLEEMAMVEDVVGTGRHPNAFLPPFPPVETEEASGMF